MLIAFDFDGTYTADPDIMGMAMDLFIAAGHRVIIVTNRGDHHPISAEAVIGPRFDNRVPVVRCYGRPKLEATQELGYEVDVWFDNEPWMIKEGPS